MRLNPIRTWTGIAAGMQFFIGGGGLTGLLSPPWPSTLILLSSAVTVGLGVYASDKTTPLGDPRTTEGIPLVPDPRVTGGETHGDAHQASTPDVPRTGGSPTRHPQP